MAERSNAAVLKTVEVKASWGSNPYFSAKASRVLNLGTRLFLYLKVLKLKIQDTFLLMVLLVSFLTLNDHNKILQLGKRKLEIATDNLLINYFLIFYLSVVAYRSTELLYFLALSLYE